MAYPSLIVKAWALVLIAATVAAKCPHRQDWKSLEGQTSEWNITIGTSNRTYLLHIPEGFSKNEEEVGIIFSYHDKHRDAYHQEKISGFSDPAHNSKYIVVYPQAANGTWCPGRSSGGNNTDDPTTKPEDHVYTSAILSQLYFTKGLCLDRTQAYATGMGNGSTFIHHLNCRNNHDPPFQAFAGVGGIPQSLDISPDRCFQAGIKPLLMIHGTSQNEHTKFKVCPSASQATLTVHCVNNLLLLEP
jgi:poly(3-hydroxybutyrate) depolymerase